MVRIISDSSTLYSVQEAKDNGLEIIPLTVTINGVTYKEIEEINTEEFIDIINEGHVPISSQPSIGEVIDLYNKYPNEEIINISMADGLSGTYTSACTAKGLADNPENIEVVNSKTLSGPHRYIVDVAVKLAKINKSKDEILKEINELIEKSQSYLIPNDFDYLVRGGRLSSLAGRISSVIKIVPVVKLSKDGRELAKFTTKRTFPNAIKKICEDLTNSLVDSSYKVYIHMHAEKIWQIKQRKSYNNVLME